MSIDPELRSLNIDVPACPATLVKLSMMLAQEKVPVQEVSNLIASDMALGSAIVRTVNSAMFGLLRRVETVHEAVRYLGMREVAGITYEMGLRAAFPPGPLIERVWRRAGLRGVAMGRVATALDIDAWLAHTSGLFAEGGRAVLYAHDRQRYGELESVSATEQEMIDAEIRAFGVSHAALGAALCQAWGLAPQVIEFVRSRCRFTGDWSQWPQEVQQLLVLGRSVDAHLCDDAIVMPQEEAEARQALDALAQQAGLSAEMLHDEVHRVCQSLCDKLTDQ